MSAPIDREERDIRVTTTTWRDYTIEVCYEPNWLNSQSTKYRFAHIEIRTISPENAPLPITSTGFRSHFTTAADVDECGGPDQLILDWLDHEAKKPGWKKLEAASRKLSLF